MANGRVLRQLIKAGRSGDIETFRQASEAVIKEERQKQHHLLAKDLESILYGENFKSDRVSIKKALPSAPVDKDKNLSLLDIREPKRSLEDLVLSSDSFSLIEEILEEHRRSDLLHSYSLDPSKKIIFHGPPGCGKTLAAEVVAYEVGYPLAIVRLDAIVSLYLGETAANLRKIFEYIDQNRLVVLFDEFDALGKDRADLAEHGEMRRIVNSILQMIDAYKGDSLIIAATNFQDLLDSAIWRRFDEKVTFTLPEFEQLRKILKLKLRGVRREFDIDDSLVELFKGFSGADVERVVIKSVKRMILAGKRSLTLADLESGVSREKRI